MLKPMEVCEIERTFLYPRRLKTIKSAHRIILKKILKEQKSETTPEPPQFLSQLWVWNIFTEESSSFENMNISL